MAKTKRSSQKNKPRPLTAGRSPSTTSKTPSGSAWILKAVVLAFLLPAALFGLILLGQHARQQISDQPRYRLAFSDIDCIPPTGAKRADFLSEVQYHAEVHDQLNILDDDLPQRLAKAFAVHPWVEQVARVTIDPPRQVRVELIYRTPVLAVRWKDKLRAVDRDGILLPPNAVTTALPIYPGIAKAPAGPNGTRWGDADVEAAARAASEKK